MSQLNQSTPQTLSFHSSALNRDMAVQVYLPRGYTPEVPLPVLYFLHGRSGDETFLDQLEIGPLMDSLIAAGSIHPLIIACPRMDNSRGMNSSPQWKEVESPGNRLVSIQLGRYEDYFMDEVIPLVEQTFSAIGTREGRMIGGASAGGYAALHNAFRHPDKFSRAGGHMPALELRLEEEDTPYFQEAGSWEKYDPIFIAQHCPPPASLRVYLDAGDQDEGRFYEGCQILHRILSKQGVPCENHVFPGHHTPDYIKGNLTRYLIFYGG